MINYLFTLVKAINEDYRHLVLQIIRNFLIHLPVVLSFVGSMF